MSHYFENDENLLDRETSVQFSFDGKSFDLKSANGVFSAERLDTGSRFLIETILEHQKEPATFLDLGCGIGVIGIVLASFWKDTKFTFVDVNEKACRLTKENLEKLNLKGDVFNQSGIEEGTYDCISLNPPIHAGKETVYALFSQAVEHLANNGTFWIVMRKSHGAPSAVKYLKSLDTDVEKVDQDKGFWILKVTKNSQ